MKRRKPSAKTKAATEGIPLWDYIKLVPESFVRVQLDRGELRYTWIDAGNNARASDDGGPQPPQGWWMWCWRSSPTSISARGCHPT